jgi:hypothetical protein
VEHGKMFNLKKSEVRTARAITPISSAILMQKRGVAGPRVRGFPNIHLFD